MVKKILAPIVGLMIVAILVACSGGPSTPVVITQTPGPTQTPNIVVVTATSAPATATLVATNTLVPTHTAAPTSTSAPTATATPDFVVGTPVGINDVPHDLSVEINYVAGPVNCAKDNDANVTCSTIVGQLTNADFSLQGNTALVMTGDAISITYDGQTLENRPDVNIAQDLWVVVNRTNKPITLHMYAPNGSFRGYFTPANGGQWTPELVNHLVNLHIERFLKPASSPEKYTPTPVANCGQFKPACDETNVRVVTYNGSWTTVLYGVYHENVLPLIGSNWEPGQ